MKTAIPRKPILLVDDEQPVCEMLHMLVEALGYDVTSTTCPIEALTIFEQGTYDAVLTDYSMPKMNGGEFARRIKEMNPTLPVVMVTGLEHYVPDNVIDGLIYKPPQLSELRRALEASVSQFSIDPKKATIDP